MSELRQDPTTNDWVIIARERAKRPHEFRRRRNSHSHLPSRKDDCPFCPGNESWTPEAEADYRTDGAWDIRVVPNKFPALSSSGDAKIEEQRFFRKRAGYGKHEVVIESPLHNMYIPSMPESRIERLISVYRDRYNEMKKDPDIRVILAFKNHGERAGTSLEHPHTQIVASTVVPPFVRRRYEIATQYFDNTGRCLYCDIIESEVELGERVLQQSEHFVVIHPFASRSPFETWILPKLHSPSFGNITDEEIRDLAAVLKKNIHGLNDALDSPDYNMIVHTAPVEDEHKTYYLWHIQIVPRLTMAAGFELGSGIYINTAVPEETAEFMRSMRAG